MEIRDLTSVQREFRLDYGKRFRDDNGNVFVVTAEMKARQGGRAWVVVSSSCKQQNQWRLDSMFDALLPIVAMELPAQASIDGEVMVENVLDDWVKTSVNLFLYAAKIGGQNSVHWPSWLANALLTEVKKDDSYFGLAPAEAKTRRMKATSERFEMLRLSTAQVHAHGLLGESEEPWITDLEVRFAKTYTLFRAIGVRNLHSAVSDFLKVDASSFNVSELSVLTNKLKRQGLIS